MSNTKESWLEALERWIEASSQNKVAKLLGLSPATLSQVRRNKYPGTVENVKSRIESLLMGQSIPDEFLINDVTGKIPERVLIETVRPFRSTREGKIQERLFGSESGQIEVSCPAGKVDLITSTEVIEIKHWRGWKEAIKVLIYKEYFPGHTPRVHLFDNRFLNRRTRKQIEDHYRRLGIRLTWEEEFMSAKQPTEG